VAVQQQARLGHEQADTEAVDHKLRADRAVQRQVGDGCLRKKALGELVPDCR
jgi:hypothetical protein